MAAQHTLGPWTRIAGERFKHDRSAGVQGPNGLYIAAALDLNRYDRDDEVEANAALIASAPELLDALQGVLAEPYGCSLCDSGTPRDPAKGHQPDCPYEIARAAIAKTRGES
jgi:hypothetical protein